MESALDDLISIAEENAHKHCLDSLAKNCQASRAELASLRARIAELEAQRDDWKLNAQCCHIERGAAQAKVSELEAQAANWKAQYDQLASAVAELHEWEPLEEAQPANQSDTAKRDTLDKVWMNVLRLNLPLSYNNSGDECEILIGGDDMIGLQEAAELIKKAVTQPAPLTPRKCASACFERGWQAAIEAAFNAVDNYEIDVESPLFDAFVRRDLEIMTIIESLTAPSSCGDCNPLKPSEHDAAMLDEWHKRM